MSRCADAWSLLRSVAVPCRTYQVREQVALRILVTPLRVYFCRSPIVLTCWHLFCDVGTCDVTLCRFSCQLKVAIDDGTTSL
jgi:hypothetical protein